MWTLDDIIELLNDHSQRATYGAVAGVVRTSPQNLMKGRDPCRRDSWIVAQANGRPTGYPESRIHPTCLRQIRDDPKDFIDNAYELRQWLNDHR